MQVPDAIEHEIDIAAPIERVWALVSEPGWYINDGAIREHRIQRREGREVVVDEVHGAFPFERVEERAPEYLATRWLPPLGDEEPARARTLVEFWLEPVDGGTRVRVRESGFASRGLPEDERRAQREGNVAGWRIELSAAKSHLEAA